MKRMRSLALPLLSRRALPAVIAMILVGGAHLPARSAAGNGAAAPDARLADAWEDLLLLQALQCLAPTREQSTQLLPLAASARVRRSQSDQRYAQTRSALERLLKTHRGMLLHARRPSSVEQEQILLLWRTLGQARTFTDDETVDLLASRLARLLARDQVQRAFLLTRRPEGTRPPQPAREPALLDPSSGFVMGSEAQQEWRSRELRRALSRRYPAQLVDALPRRAQALVSLDLTSTITFELDMATSGYLVVTPEQAAEPSKPDPVVRASEAQVQAVRREIQALRPRSERVSELFMEGADEAERVRCLAWLAELLFRSERFRPVLADRLGVPAGRPGPARFEHEARDTDPRLAQAREEVLLLEALRYLRLSPDQLGQLSAAADTSAQILAKQQEADGAVREQLEQFAAGGREWLLSGRSLPPGPQEQALAAAKALRQARGKLETEINQARAKDLARILTHRQAARAHLLAGGLWPRDEAKPVLLLDPASGFVLNEAIRRDWQDAAIQAILLRRYPAEVVPMGLWRHPSLARDGITLTVSKGMSTRPGPVEFGYAAAEATNTDLFTFTRGLRGVDSGEAALPPALRPLRAAALRDRDSLDDRLADLPRLLREGATEEELTAALRPIVRRLFLSPRFEPILRALKG